MPWTEANLERMANKLAENHYGYGDGFRDLRLKTQYEDSKWRALAAEHDAARRRLNGLLSPASHQRRRAEGAIFFGDHTRFESPGVQDALRAYRAVCVAALAAPSPKPRRVPTLIRLAAELAGAPDPAWSAADWGGGLSKTDFALNKLYRQTCLALYRAGLT